MPRQRRYVPKRSTAKGSQLYRAFPLEFQIREPTNVRTKSGARRMGLRSLGLFGRGRFFSDYRPSNASRRNTKERLNIRRQK